MLGKCQGNRRRRLWEIAKDRDPWHATVDRVAKSQT